jgi:hypothetical protein
MVDTTGSVTLLSVLLGAAFRRGYEESVRATGWNEVVKREEYMISYNR